MTWVERPTTKMANVPTLREVYGFASAAPWGIAGPKGMDPKIVRILHDAFREAMEEPSFVETLERLGMESNYLSTADYTAYARKQFDASRVVVERLGLKP